MDAQLIAKLQSLVTTLDTTQLATAFVENQKIINDLARMCLQGAKDGKIDLSELNTPKLTEPTPKVKEVKHTDFAKLCGVQARTIARACKDGRIKNWRQISERIIGIPEEECERVRPLFTKEEY